jgi:hypothetical protein
VEWKDALWARGRTSFRRGTIARAGRSENSINQEIAVTKSIILGTTLIALTFPLSIHAQGVPGGAARGAAEGGEAAGPLGAVVGGVVGGVTGGVAGILGVDDRPRFREYVVREQVPSYTYSEPLAVGAVLPEAGVRYYDVPAEYGSARGYHYTIVNGRTVLVEPRTRRIIQFVD